MLGDAAARRNLRRDAPERCLCDRLLLSGRPAGQARIRTQMSAAHSREDLEFAVNAFAEVKEELAK